MLWSFVSLVVRNLFALVWLLARPRRSKELEILRLMPPEGRDPTPLEAIARLRRRDLLVGLIHEYEAA